MLRFVVTTTLLLASPVASATTIERTVPASGPTALFPLFGLEHQACTAYRVHDAKVSAPPAHGAALLVEHAVPLPKEFAVCAGKVVKALWVVYKPAAGFRGTDRFSVSYTLPTNTGELYQRYNTMDFNLTVK